MVSRFATHFSGIVVRRRNYRQRCFAPFANAKENLDDNQFVGENLSGFFSDGTSL
jgi:hypothetical protein